MDTHLVIKIVHMSSLLLLIIAVLARATTLYFGVENQQPNPKGRKAYVALQHLAFTLVIGTGLILLFLNNFQVQPWFYAKVVLVIVMLSSLIKAYRQDASVLLIQRRAGVLISCVAFMAIIGIVMIKPTFG
ncbi:SirB2 family protein [Acinetobacter sp. YH16032]|uniref:SirB2 family protein n=1 Tax=Acinetobacter sp. YH16032 TaxID=2601181 RepID=UPI0015D31216|nr:SirB2 family protein [Acinetobacter sp. YH16032]